MSIADRVDVLRRERNIYLKAIDSIDETLTKLYLAQITENFTKTAQTVNGL